MIFSLLYDILQLNTQEAHECNTHQACDDKGNTYTLERSGNIAIREFFTNSSYTYDGNGNVTKMVYGSTSGYIYYSYTTTYDSSNMPTKKVYTQGSEQMTHTFTYNESRTEVKVNTVSFDGENMVTTCKYRLAYIESDITDQQIEDILQDVIMFME